MYLPFLQLDDIDNYAWGVAVVAALKVSMKKVKTHLTSEHTKSLTGFSYVLMVRHLSTSIYNNDISFDKNAYLFTFSCRHLHLNDSNASATCIMLLTYVNFLSWWGGWR
jgi:hypothetical protein